MNKYETAWDDQHEDAGLRVTVCVPVMQGVMGEAEIYWKVLIEGDVCSSSAQRAPDCCAWTGCCEVFGTEGQGLTVNVMRLDPLWDDEAIGSLELAPPIAPMATSWYNLSTGLMLQVSLSVDHREQVETIDGDAQLNETFGGIAVVASIVIAVLCFIHKLWKCVRKNKCACLLAALSGRVRQQAPITQMISSDPALSVRPYGVAVSNTREPRDESGISLEHEAEASSTKV